MIIWRRLSLFSRRAASAVVPTPTRLTRTHWPVLRQRPVGRQLTAFLPTSVRDFLAATFSGNALLALHSSSLSASLSAHHRRAGSTPSAVCVGERLASGRNAASHRSSSNLFLCMMLVNDPCSCKEINPTHFSTRYTWIDYGMRPKNNVNNRTSGDCQSHSVVNKFKYSILDLISGMNLYIFIWYVGKLHDINNVVKLTI